MKKLAEKIALVAELCIALVFILTTLLYMTNAIPQPENWETNGVMVVLMIVLAVLFLGIAVYLLYMNFSNRENLKQILLFCDSESATKANIKVVENIVNGCAKQVKGVSVRKLRIRSDEKGGFAAIINVRVTVDNVAESINKLRCLLTDSFKETLGLTFNTVNFHIERIRGQFEPNVKKAEETAEILSQNQETTSANYAEPLNTKPSYSDGEFSAETEDNNEKKELENV